MDDLKPIIAKNIIDLRKSMNWTQADFAQRLNYSDKAISKWERAESIPDIAVLKAIADLFNVNLDYLVEAEHTQTADTPQGTLQPANRNRLIVALLSATLVYLIATILFVAFELFPVQLGLPSWMVYVYALPILFIVLLVFNSIWGKRKVNFLIVSLLVWSILLVLYLTFLSHNIWLIFMVGIPAQVIILLWAGFNFKLPGR